MPRLLLMAAALLAVSCGVAAGASPPPMEIVGPRSGTVVTGSAVDVTVRVRGSATAVVLEARSDRAPALERVRLRRAGAGLWTARMRVGRDLDPGRNTLVARVVRAAGAPQQGDTVRFTVAPRRGDLVSLRVVAPGRDPAAPRAVRLRLAAGAEGFRATLDGRSVRALFEPVPGTRDHVAHIAAHDGLHFGRNRLVVTVHSRVGRHEHLIRDMVVPRSGPIAAAGRDRTVREGAALRLDGRRTRAAGPRSGLTLRWRIVSRPRGSTAVLRDARGPRPVLRPDRPGRYEVRLTAAERVPAPRSGAREQQARVTASSRDTVTVSAQPATLPRGLPTQLASGGPSPGITVGDETYPGSPGTITMVVLDRDTLEPTTVIDDPVQAIPAIDSGVQAVTDVANAITNGQVMLLAGTGTTFGAPISPSGFEQLTSTLATLGGYFDPTYAQREQEAVLSGQWSFIGIPGAPPGEAYQLMGLQMEPGATPGTMSGYFQPDTGGNHSFTWTYDYVPFDTQTPQSTATKSFMRIGPQTYTSADLGGTPGFHLVVLDADTLEFQGEYTFTEGFGTGAGNSPDFVLTQIAPMFAAQRPAFVILSTIGAPLVPPLTSAPDGSDGESGGNAQRGQLVQLLEGAGASPELLASLQGDGGYAMVGHTGMQDAAGPSAATQIASAVSGTGTSRLAGALKRNRQGLWEAMGGAAPAPGADVSNLRGLRQILAQPDQGFPAFSAPGEAAAFAYIVQQMRNYVLPDPTFGLRGLYWTDTSIDWSTQQGNLGNIPACTSDPCAGSYAAVKAQLIEEFGLVETVRDYFDGGAGSTLRETIDEAFIESSVGFTGTTTAITKQFQPPPAARASGPSALALIEGLLNTVGSVGAFFPAAAPAVAGEVSFVDAVSDISEVFEAVGTTRGGTSQYGIGQFEAEVDDFATQLSAAWSGDWTGLDVIADLLVSDWGRLQAAALKVDTPSPQGGWGLSTDVQTSVTRQMYRNTVQYIWYSLLPSAEAVYECALPDAPTTNPQAALSSYVPYIDGVSGPGYYASDLVLGKRDRTGTPQMLDATTTATLFGAWKPWDPGDTDRNGKPVPLYLGFAPHTFMAAANNDVAGNTTSPGFLRKNTNLADQSAEAGFGLALRNSSYRPACGHYWKPGG